MDLLKYLKDNNAQEQINKLAQELKNKKIVFYGAGEFFELIYKNYDLSNLNIVAISDLKFGNNITDNKILYSQIAPNKLANFDFDCIVVTLVNYYAIKNYLKTDILKNSKKEKIEIFPLIKTEDDNIYTYENAILRTSFYNETNKKLVEFSKNRDFESIIDYIFSLYKQFPNLFNDEYFNNRYGMNEIYNEILQMDKNLTILDVGCGNCELIAKLYNSGFKNIMGTDASIHRIIRNRKKYTIPLYCAFAENMPLKDNSVDIVIAQEVLEHCCDIKQALSEIKRVLSNKGKVFFQVPYKHMVDCDNHVRLFSKKTFCKIVSEYFDIESCEIIPYTNKNIFNNIYVRAQNNK